MNIKQQTAKEKVWKDEQGIEIPYNRTKPVERNKERAAYKLAKEAVVLNVMLQKFKGDINKTCEDIFQQVLTESERTKVGKGNFTWYNFDGSIKIEVSVNENIDFDTLLIEKAKQKLLDLIGESISAEKDMIKELVLSAFQTSKGKLDTKKILGLKKHASRIKDKRYHEAMQLIDSSIRRPDSKTYFRVWVKDESGQHKNIDLNFSSI